jgi:HEAT repeat protein
LRSFLAVTDSEKLRAAILKSLINNGNSDVNDDVQLLNEYLNKIKDEEVLAGLVYLFHLLGDDEIAIMRGLYSTGKSRRLRATIIDELTHLPTEDALPLAYKALTDDPEPAVRATAIRTLYYVLWPEHSLLIKYLADALDDTALIENWSGDGPTRVCDEAAEFLTHLDQPEAVAALAEWQRKNPQT